MDHFGSNIIWSKFDHSSFGQGIFSVNVFRLNSHQLENVDKVPQRPKKHRTTNGEFEAKSTQSNVERFEKSRK